MSNIQKINIESVSADISENTIRDQMPDILDILLIDRTTSTVKRNKNIIWANENYTKYGKKDYAATVQIKPELISSHMGHLMMTRALKISEIQKIKTRLKSVFLTPTWVVKKQNDLVEANYLEDDLETYVRRKWLEIT